jgi:hypothetical protein
MGALETLAYMAGGTVVVVLLAWLAGCCRSHKTRPAHEEHPRSREGRTEDLSRPTHHAGRVR